VTAAEYRKAKAAAIRAAYADRWRGWATKSPTVAEPTESKSEKGNDR
jgi:hypothetical protein